ncbi:MAG: M1 family metallopeptidase [Bacteroides sp.]|nr:M1 family metallopeptidase [Bacteroides sp.]
MIKKYARLSVLFFAVILSLPFLSAQDHQERWSTMDVQHYRFDIQLNDTSDIIFCSAEVEILFKTDVQNFSLDFANLSPEGRGMKIDRITENGDQVPFIHENNLLHFQGNESLEGTSRKLLIDYHGIPNDGLIISENKFGDRTFFGDNWPNRAHHWLPVVDHPSDKATVEFIIKAPSHYGVVSIGSKTREIWDEDYITTHWEMKVPLSTKLMVLGVSPFEVEHLESASGLPVSSWVYPQNRDEGFSDYSVALGPIDFFEKYIAPFPFTKLANVQSKTRYGGMENATCIFYNERTVTGQRDKEPLFAHEIAHQWYGDAVSELDWHHIWISEGFATYLTDLYIENTHGREAFLAAMLDEKRQVLEFAKQKLAPIVDTTLPVSVKLLNKNSYEKAGWVLHMLRHELGDELFQCCVRTFYNDFKYDNALTEDFLAVVEYLSGRDFKDFFQQWFHTAGHPVLYAPWKYRRGQIQLTIQQQQDHHLFHFPLELRIELKDGSIIDHKLQISQKEETFLIPTKVKPKQILLDPESWLLFEYPNPL